ncbi:hypothetical protein BDV18DRAFT_131119, partial [Aspergillus unguis]
MLLELFGYISGDERLHEIAEVYHWEMVEIVQMYNLWPSSGSEGEKERKRTIEGLCILECYRVSILNGSATFGLALPLALNPASVTEGGEPLQTQLQWMFSDTPTPPQGIDSETWSLCCLSLLLAWALPNSTLQRHQLTPSHTRRREFLNSALSRWSRLCYDNSTHSTRLLFHLVSLSLHANLVQIEKAAYHCAETANHPETVPETDRKYHPPAEAFPSDIDRLNAAWHASRIMHLTSEWQNEKTNNRLTEEPPHLVYCVFFAALTLLSASSTGDALTGPVPYATQALSVSSVPVSKKLLFVLRCVDGNTV